MITKPTVLILGAGASMMYGFPSGLTLKQQIIRWLNKRGEAIYQEYKHMGFNRSEVDSFVKALDESGTNSVDSFLEHRKDLVNIGKTAIAQALIPSEKESKFRDLKEGDWYGYLLDRLNSPPEQFNQNKITILTFNYDRSIEWYMYKALIARLKLNSGDAVKLVNMMSIIHLYGTLGGLPWENGRQYEPSIERDKIYQARDKIKIIHESVGNDQEFKLGLDALASATRIIFLGFGYNKVNIQRLQPDKWTKARAVFGSAYGKTELEKKTIESLLHRTIHFGQHDWDILNFLREMVDLEAP